MGKLMTGAKGGVGCHENWFFLFGLCSCLVSCHGIASLLCKFNFGLMVLIFSTNCRVNILVETLVKLPMLHGANTCPRVAQLDRG